jgi:hydrogenase nickel incorporation protein HypB
MVVVVEANENEVYDIELEEHLLSANLSLAQENAAFFKRFGIRAIDIMGAIGSGKTSLIKNMIHDLKDKYKIAAFDGDVATTIDADLLAKEGVPVIQITTGKECHLDANLVKKALSKLDPKGFNLLFIENVGNLICPAEFPLGSGKRLVVISVTEGPYMVRKHPHMFMGTDVVAINKTDLAEIMGIDVTSLSSDVKKVNPKAHVVPTSCRSGDGLSEIISALDL